MSVESKNKYTIEYKTLAAGRYEYNYQLDSKFFSQFQYSEVQNGNVNVIVYLTVFNSGLELEFNVSGQVELPCDRCGDNMQLPVKGKYNLNVRYGQENSNFSDTCDEIVLSNEEYEIDLTQFLYEYALLSIPVRRVHKTEKECNQEVMAQLKNYSSTQKTESQPDERWSKLKDLYN